MRIREKEEEKSAIHFHSFIHHSALFVYTHNAYTLISSRAHIEKLARRPPVPAPRAAPTEASREREKKKDVVYVSLCTSLSNCLSSTLRRESGTSNERTTRRVLVLVLLLRKRWSESSTTRLSFVRSFVAKTTTSWRESIFVSSQLCFVAVDRRRSHWW